MSPERYHDPVLWVWLGSFSFPKKNQFFILSPVIFFRFNNLKCTAKTAVVDILRLNTARAAKTRFLTPKGSRSTSVIFIMGVLPPA